MIRYTDSECAWDKRGLNEPSDPWDPPELPSIECSLIAPSVKQAVVQQRDIHDSQMYVPVVTPSIKRDR